MDVLMMQESWISFQEISYKVFFKGFKIRAEGLIIETIRKW